jgi:hypothetical protein
MISSTVLKERQETKDSKRAYVVTSLLFELSYYPVLKFIIKHFFKTVHYEIEQLRKLK